MEEDEWEEEEQLVVAELSGMIDSDALSNCHGTCKLVCVDSEQPVMQVGRYVLAGEYEDAPCTCVIFEEHRETGRPERTASDPELRYKCHTTKKLMLQRTFLSERKEDDEPNTGAVEILTLNEGKFAGRNCSVCRYTTKTEATDRSKTPEEEEEEEEEEHEESDTEMA